MTGLRRAPSTDCATCTLLQWYVIPMLAVVFYVYTTEIKKAARSGNWNAVIAGLTLFGMDFFNETWNGWVMVLTGSSAFWTAPGPTALRTMVGWNIEIMFMFAIAGIIFYNSLSTDPRRQDPRPARPLVLGHRLFGLLRLRRVPAQHGRPPRLGIPLLEPHLRRRLADLPLRLFHFYVADHPRLGLEEGPSYKVIAVASIYAVPILMNIIGLGYMGWRY